MKKMIVGLMLGLSVFFLAACGNSDPTVGEIKDYVVDRYQRFEEENGEGRTFTEDDFSFKIYHDKKRDLYIGQALVPLGKNESEQYFGWTGEGTEKMDSSDFGNVLHVGDYEVIYVNGKFE